MVSILSTIYLPKIAPSLIELKKISSKLGAKGIKRSKISKIFCVKKFPKIFSQKNAFNKIKLSP